MGTDLVKKTKELFKKLKEEPLAKFVAVSGAGVGIVVAGHIDHPSVDELKIENHSYCQQMAKKYGEKNLSDFYVPRTTETCDSFIENYQKK